MKIIFKVANSILSIVICLLLLCGCFDRRELDTIGIVMGTAIDKAENDEAFTVTIQIANPNESSGGSGMKTEKDSGDSGGGSSEYINISESGITINGIIREIQNKMSRRLYVAHSQNIIFGEDLVKEDIKDCIDFFARAPESRMTQLLFIAEGKAGDIYDVSPEFESMQATMLTKILKDQKLTAHAPIVTLYEFICCMIRKTKCPVLPLVHIVEDEDKQRLEVDGCAVFKANKMVGKFDETQTRGLLFIQNRVKAGVLILNVEDAEITAEIRKASSHVKAYYYEDGTAKFEIEVSVVLGLGDQTGTFNIADPDNAPQLMAAGEEAIKNEIQSAVDKSKELNADVFGFAEYIKRKYSDQWEYVSENWDSLYPNISVEITVTAKPDGSGRISVPLIPESV